VLKGVVKDAVYTLSLLLFVGCRIIASPERAAIPEMVDYCERLLEMFVKHSADKSVFGPGFVSYNIHGLLHLCDDVKRFGDINKWSAFPFENYLKFIKGLMRTGVKVAQQIARRLAEIEAAYEGPKLTSEMYSTSGWDEESLTYKSISNAQFMLAPSPFRESFFRLGKDCIGKVKKITKTAADVIIADVCETLESFFNYPDDSRKYGVYQFRKWTALNVTETDCKREFPSFNSLRKHFFKKHATIVSVHPELPRLNLTEPRRPQRNLPPDNRDVNMIELPDDQSDVNAGNPVSPSDFKTLVENEVLVFLGECYR